MTHADNNFQQRQFIYTAPENIFNDPDLSLTDLKIYMIIRSFIDSTGSAYPSNNWLASRLSVHRVTIITSLNKLIDKQYLVRKEIKGRRYLSINVAQLDEELVVPTLSPSSLDTTPPSSVDTTQLYQTIITSKHTQQSVGFVKKLNNDFSVDEMLKDNPHKLSEEYLSEWKNSRRKPLTKRVWTKTNQVLTELAAKGLPATRAFEIMLQKSWADIELHYFDSYLNNNLVKPKLSVEDIRARDEHLAKLEEQSRKINDIELAKLYPQAWATKHAEKRL